MPILPLEHPEPFAATLGVMLYPGADEEDRRRAFASQYLAKPLRLFHEQGGALSYAELAQLAEGGGVVLDDLDERWRQGTATGQMFKALFALANTDSALASWENAVKIAEDVARRNRAAGVRSSLHAARRRYRPVAHLWAAWCIREGQITARPELGYEGWHDFQFFLAEAEILREWGQTWKPERAKAKPPLPTEAWRVPEGWAPPERQPGWPPTGKVPVLTVPEELAELRKPGRPARRR